MLTDMNILGVAAQHCSHGHGVKESIIRSVLLGRGPDTAESAAQQGRKGTRMLACMHTTMIPHSGILHTWHTGSPVEQPTGYCRLLLMSAPRAPLVVPTRC